MAGAAFNRAAADFRSEVHLLIIQRNELLARSFARYLRPYYAEVHVAATAADADLVLPTLRTNVHVVCGQRLGADEVDGVGCIQRWRQQYPAIVRAVLASSAEIVRDEVPSGDDGFRTPSEPRALEGLLLSTPTGLRDELWQLSQFESPTTLTEDSMKTTKTQTKAHDLKTLKEKSTIAPRPSAGTLSTAQGFSVA